jgi:hypothetical protein
VDRAHTLRSIDMLSTSTLCSFSRYDISAKQDSSESLDATRLLYVRNL